MLWFWNIMWTLCKIANACYCVKIPHLSAFKYNRMFNLSKRLQSLLLSSIQNDDWRNDNDSNGGGGSGDGKRNGSYKHTQGVEMVVLGIYFSDLFILFGGCYAMFAIDTFGVLCIQRKGERERTSKWFDVKCEIDRRREQRKVVEILTSTIIHICLHIEPHS